MSRTFLRKNHCSMVHGVDGRRPAAFLSRPNNVSQTVGVGLAREAGPPLTDHCRACCLDGPVSLFTCVSGLSRYPDNMREVQPQQIHIYFTTLNTTLKGRPTLGTSKI